MADDIFKQLAEFAGILQRNAPLAPLTAFRIGGPAEVLAEPTTTTELANLVRRCHQLHIPLHVIGAGGNLVVRDDGAKGVVLRMSAPSFTEIRVEGRKIFAGCGADLPRLVQVAAEHGLSGIETLVGLPGTVGGAIKLNAGDRSSEIGQFVRKVEVIDIEGNVHVRDHEDMQFGLEQSNLDEPVLLSAELELEKDRPEAIVKRIRKAWIQHSSTQPFAFQAAGRMFKNPPGLNATALVEQAGLAGTTVGGAQISPRNPNYIVVEAGTTTRDVLRLIEMARTKVKECFNLELDLALSVW